MNITTQEILDYVKEQPDTRTWDVFDHQEWILASLLVEKYGVDRATVSVEVYHFYVDGESFDIPFGYANLIEDSIDDDDSDVWSKSVAVEKIQGAVKVATKRGLS